MGLDNHAVIASKNDELYKSARDRGIIPFRYSLAHGDTFDQFTSSLGTYK